MESAKRKSRRHVTGATDEAGVVATIAAAMQQEDTAARVAAATRDVLLYLGLNPGQLGLVNAVVTAASTGSSTFPQMVLPESPRASVTHPIPGFHVYPQASLFSGECSPEVSVVEHFTLVLAPIDLNATPIAGGSLFGEPRKRAREMRADMLPGSRNLFDRMSATIDGERANRFMQSIIFGGDMVAADGAGAAGYDPHETQSQDGRGPFTPSTYGQVGMQAAFMQDQVGLDVDDFLHNHEFPEDYDLKEEDELDIDGEPLFEDGLTNQAVWVKPKPKRRRMKTYTAAKDKLLCECWRDIGQDPKVGAEQKASTFWTCFHREFHECKKFPSYQMQSTRGWVSILKRWKEFQTLEGFKVQHEGRSFHLSHCWRIIKDEEKFKAQYVAIMASGGKKAVAKEVALASMMTGWRS
ncbi:DNA repair protein rhp54 [Hordeum vulgare]|nr:DNA repair protein rhp54 [Hordeum vulgare]